MLPVHRKTMNHLEIKHRKPLQSGKLTFQFWTAWIGYLTCNAAEFSELFWAGSLIRDRTGTTAAISTLCVVSLTTGMVVGRIFGPRVMKSLAIDLQLTLFIGIQILGFSTFWFSHLLSLSCFGLFLAGVGFSMQLPLLALRLVSHSENRPDLALGKCSLAAGLALAIPPFVLGVLGDHFGISRAYVLVPILIGITLITVHLVKAKEVVVEEIL